MDATQTIIAADTTRLQGVRVIGVDEHRWSHTRRPGEDRFVTVIIDLTPVLDAPAAPGCSTWCQDAPRLR